MSYCVNCGVRLAPSEPKCPLCNTLVVNPAQPWENMDKLPYPKRLDTFPNKKINKRYAAQLASLAIFILVGVLVFCDIITNTHLTWSIYAIGTATYSCCLLTPLYFHFRSPYIPLSINIAATELVLLLIAWQNHGATWFLFLALPFVLLIGIYVCLCVWLMRKSNKSDIRALAACLLFCAAMLIGIECLVDLYISSTISLLWSLYALLPLFILSVVMIVISFKPRVVEEIKKRLYM